MRTQRKVHNLRDSSETHGTISTTTNIHPSPSTDRNHTMNTELPLTAMASACSTVPSVWVALDSYTKMNGSCAQSPALTPEQARQFAAELIASAESAEAAAAERKAEQANQVNMHTFTVELQVAARGTINDLELAAIIDLHEWSYSLSDEHQAEIVDAVFVQPQMVREPLAKSDQRALYMDEIELPFDVRMIPLAYRQAADDWMTFSHKHGASLQLANLLWLLDTNGEVR